MANKKTNKDFFNEVIAISGANKELAEWAAKQIKALEKKAENRKPTKEQVANIGLKADILETLKAINKPATVSELLATGRFEATITNQKLTSLLTQMVKTKEVVRETDKKKAFYSVPSEDENEESEVKGE